MNKPKKMEPKKNNKEIKSLYIIKATLSFLNEKQRLNIIMYNKEM